MKALTRKETYAATPAAVFNTLDDLGVSGMHMTESSAMMMGSKLTLQFLTRNKTGRGSIYRWTGKMMGLPMDFTVEVTQWIDGREKVWETIGPAKMILYSWYRMNLVVSKAPGGAEASLSITYEKPKGLFNRILCFLFANLYCHWCLRKMLGDAKKTIEAGNTHPSFA